MFRSLAKPVILIIIVIVTGGNLLGQQPYCPDVLKPKKEKLYNYLDKVIKESLSYPLNAQHEESWMQAFYPLQLLQKHDESIDQKITDAVKHLAARSLPFQTSLLELVYANYPGTYSKEIKTYLPAIKDPKLFAIAAEYIHSSDTTSNTRRWITALQKKLSQYLGNNLLLTELISHIRSQRLYLKKLDPFFQNDYLPGQVLVISLQRKNRDYPGIVIVRDTSGNLLRDSSGNIFYLPQLARSISGLPYYLSNGNTPQGLFRMTGFDVSRSSFIGPTKNIQMSMPFEVDASLFMNDSSFLGREITPAMYRQLLPEPFKHYTPLYETFSAGRLGRNEIIAHGTTIDSGIYNGKPYFPFTPTLGCLCTREVWNESTGFTDFSDQQLLVDAITRAGGPSGYVIVLDIGDESSPVDINELTEKLIR